MAMAAAAAGGAGERGVEPGAEDVPAGSALPVVSLDDAASDGGDEDLDDEAAEARLQALTARLEEVVGALSETEEANDLLKEEIKQLLAEQDEQDELRNELHEQLHERSELMQLMARQTVTDSMASSDMLDRIRQLREEAEAEKKTFEAEMEAMGKQLQTLETNDAETQERLGPLDDVD